MIQYTDYSFSLSKTLMQYEVFKSSHDQRFVDCRFVLRIQYTQHSSALPSSTGHWQFSPVWRTDSILRSKVFSVKQMPNHYIDGCDCERNVIGTDRIVLQYSDSQRYCSKWVHQYVKCSATSSTCWFGNALNLFQTLESSMIEQPGAHSRFKVIEYILLCTRTNE